MRFRDASKPLMFASLLVLFGLGRDAFAAPPASPPPAGPLADILSQLTVLNVQVTNLAAAADEAADDHTAIEASLGRIEADTADVPAEHAETASTLSRIESTLASIRSTVNAIAPQMTNEHAAITNKLDELEDALDELADRETDLSSVTRIWDQRLPADDGSPCNSSRFTCVFDDQAVRDNETGLVWERSPEVFTPAPGEQSFGLPWDTRVPMRVTARDHCRNRVIAGRQGWRLPFAEELTSLLDRSGAVPGGEPQLPPGHPFDTDAISNDDTYWSATGDATSALGQELPRAYIVNVNTGNVEPILYSLSRSAWCVRGPASTPIN